MLIPIRSLTHHGPTVQVCLGLRGSQAASTFMLQLGKSQENQSQLVPLTVSLMLSRVQSKVSPTPIC